MRTSDVVVKLAAIKVVKEAVAKAERDVKDWLEEAMDPGDRKGALVGDDSVGTVSYSKSTAKAEVHDRAAFTAWATDAHPSEVKVTLTLDADDVMGAILHARGDAPNQTTAEAGLAMAHAWQMAYVRVTNAIRSTPAQVNAAWEAKILADVVKAKAAVDTTTGEEIPGVRYVPGGQGGHISVRVSEDQAANLVTAWHNGDVDLLDLATTPVAIEVGS